MCVCVYVCLSECVVNHVHDYVCVGVYMHTSIGVGVPYEWNACR